MIQSPYAGLLRKSFDEARAIVIGTPEAIERANATRAQLDRYRNDPVGFFHDVLGIVTWSMQRYAAEALLIHQLLLMCGCRKSTKSHLMSASAVHKVATKPTRCIVTAPNFKQVRNNVFARMRKLIGGSKIRLPGRVGVTSWRMDDPTWYAIGITTNTPDDMQGWHPDVTLPEHYKFSDEDLPAPDPELEEQDLRRAEKDPLEVIDEEVWRHRKLDDGADLLLVIDELKGVKADIIETMLGSLIGDKAFAITGFNPTFSPDDGHPASKFLKPGSRFHRIHIAAREPPAESHDDTLFDKCFHRVPPEIITDKWVKDSIAHWGEGDPMTLAHVFGLPSATDQERQFIPFRLLRPALTRKIDDPGTARSRHIGWDVAGSSGGDWNVAQLWIAGQLKEQERWRWADTSKSTDRVLELAHKWRGADGPIPSRNIHVDATGGSLGKACADFMRARGHRIDAVDFGAAPMGDWTRLVGPDTAFVNRKAELLWVLRCALDRGIAAVPATFGDFIRQCQWYTWKEKDRGDGTAIAVVESKDDLREMYGRSPDDLEAGMLAWSRVGVGISVGTISSTGEFHRRMNGY